jgi:hypothetical protein
MKKLLFVGALLLSVSAIASAHDDHSFGDHQGSGDQWTFRPDEHHAVAPEIDAASAAGALTLLIGGLIVLRGRRTTR